MHTAPTRDHPLAAAEVAVDFDFPQSGRPEQRGDCFALIPTDLDGQKSPGGKMVVDAGEYGAVGVEPVGTSVEGEPGIVQAHFAVEAGDDAAGDIRRVGNDEAEAAGDRGEEIAESEIQPAVDAVAGGILAGAPLAEVQAWLVLLAACGIIVTTVSIMVFEYVIRE